KARSRDAARAAEELDARQRREVADVARGLAEQIALDVVAAAIAHEGQRLGRVHHLGDGADLHGAAEPAQGGEKSPSFGGFLCVLDRRAVELHEVDLEHREILERGGAGAEIVEADAVAEGAQRLDEIVRLLEIAHARAFGDLKHQLAARPFVGLEQLHQRVEIGILANREARDVHRDVEAVAVARPLAEPIDDLLRHRQIELVDEAGLLGEGDGPERRFRRILLEAAQRLVVMDLAADRMNDRLKHDIEFRQRDDLLEVVDLARRLIDEARHVGGDLANIDRALVAEFVHEVEEALGELRAVERGGIERDGRGIDPRAFAGGVEAARQSFDLPRQVAELRARRMHDRELAAGDPRRGIAAQRIGFEHIAQPMQHRCALLIAEALLQRLDLGHGQERELCRLARSLDFLEALGGELGKAPGIMESARRVARLRKRQRLCRGIGLAQADIDFALDRVEAISRHRHPQEAAAAVDDADRLAMRAAGLRQLFQRLRRDRSVRGRDQVAERARDQPVGALSEEHIEGAGGKKNVEIAVDLEQQIRAAESERDIAVALGPKLIESGFSGACSHGGTVLRARMRPGQSSRSVSRSTAFSISDLAGPSSMAGLTIGKAKLIKGFGGRRVPWTWRAGAAKMAALNQALPPKEIKMTWGVPTALFLQFHVAISLLGIATGLIVFWGLLSGRLLPGWTACCLATLVLTSVTGFPLPPLGFDPARATGVISLVLLALAIVARYGFRLA